MNYIKCFLIVVLSLLITTFIIGSLSFFNIINDKLLNVFQIISLFVTVFIESYYLGKRKDKKGYLEGLINGSIISILFLIFNFLFKRNYSAFKLLIYFFIIITSMIASILGINKKTKD